MLRKSSFLYALYGARLRKACPPELMPQHIGIILDGNRRWASAEDLESSEAYSRGGEKLHEVLRWCDQASIRLVTVWMLSTENLQRPAEEVDPLCAVIGQTVDGLVSAGGRRLRHLGSPDILPTDLQHTIKRAVEATADEPGMTVNLAVGYGGRQEIADALRSMLESHPGKTLEEVLDSLSVESIGQHLYTAGQPDPDLVIRTSGEQRLSGFLLWQTAHTEFYFCEALWPNFREVDFWRALRSYASRQRRYGR